MCFVSRQHSSMTVFPWRHESVVESVVQGCGVGVLSEEMVCERERSVSDSVICSGDRSDGLGDDVGDAVGDSNIVVVVGTEEAPTSILPLSSSCWTEH